MLEVGAVAPDFELLNQAGEKLTLSQFKGQKVAIYFYPKDDTPGCTKQACSVRDNEAVLKAKGVVVLGISADSVESHQKFVSKYNLNFPLLADTDRKTIEAYGVWGEKNMYGKKVMGLSRTTFLIDETGVISHIWKRPKTEIHAEEILAKI
jgi:thioredoxin-dependent peroxiredoxin